MESNSVWLKLVELQDKEVFSFDIFDTLIARLSGHSSNLHACVERRAKIQGMDSEGFAAKRMEAEDLARRKASGEITLDDVYVELARIFESADIERLKAMEVEAELDLCVPISPVIDAFNLLISSGKTVVLTSDMYLPKKEIEKILKRNGVGRYVELFVSSEVGARKDSGKLFEHLLEELGVNASQVVHIGDNPVSDVFVPRSLGIEAIQVRSGQVEDNPLIVQRIMRKAKKIFSKSEKSFSDALYADDSLSSLGLRVLGPLLFAFCNWLHKELEDEGIDHIMFMSRDGLLLKKAYDIIFPEDSSIYVYGSRRSLIIPTLWRDSSLKGIFESFPLVGSIPLSSFVERLGLTFDQVATTAQLFGFSEATEVSERFMLGDSGFLSFYESIESLVYENSLVEYEACINYLKSVFGEKGKYAFVDIGWTGYMQKALCDLLEGKLPDVEVFGYFTGLRPKWPLLTDKRYSMKGFLFENDLNEEVSERQRIYNELYEVIFSANHGTVEKFAVDDSGVAVPVLLENERSASQQEIVDRVQAAALQFVSMAKSRKLQLYLDFSPSVIIELFERIGLSPSLQEARTLGELCIYESGVFHLVDTRKLSCYIRNPKSFFRDFKTSRWKPAFLKSTVHVSAPYIALNRLKRRLKERGGNGD